MKVLLIGGTGFVGGHLQNYLQNECGFQVYTHDLSVDVRNAGQLTGLIKSVRPDSVVHLAAQSSVPESFKNPYDTFDINFTGTLNLLMSLKTSDFKGRMLYIGSSQVYGSLADYELPVSEEKLLKPNNPYAVSKVAAEALCYQWSRTADFEIVMVRPFNHIGPGQSENFVVSDFARQLVEIELGMREAVLHVGDIDVTRDFTDVRDVVAAYRLLLARAGNGEVYNVCSGKEHSIRSLLLQMLKITGLDVKVEQDENRLRPSEQRRIFGSFDKLYKDTGWQPKIAIHQTLCDVLQDWRKRIS